MSIPILVQEIQYLQNKADEKMTEKHIPMRRTYKQKNRRLKRAWLIILLIIIAAVVALTVCFVLNNAEKNNPNEAAVSAGTEIEKNEDIISIPGYEGLTLKADTCIQELALNNPPQNTCYFVITLYLEDGTELWKSEMIEAGGVSKAMILNKELPAGNYPALLKYECFRMDDNKTPLNGAEMKLTLRVK